MYRPCPTQPQKLEVMSSPQNQKHTMSLHNDIMRISVLGFRCDIRIELQAPVIQATLAVGGKFNKQLTHVTFFKTNGLHANAKSSHIS